MNGLLIFAIIAVVIIVIVAYFVKTYNKLVELRNRVKDQWAQIDVQLKRRFDLIPNLVETVKGYAKHEKETLENVIAARNSYISAGNSEEQIKANNELTGAISKLFALAESYPDLKANTNFLEMQNDLKETEDKIAMARQFYNDTVLQYNNCIEMFPSNVIANMFKFKAEAFFEIADTERKNVSVKF